MFRRPDESLGLTAHRKAPFVDRVEDYVSTRADVEKTMQSFQEMISCVG